MKSRSKSSIAPSTKTTLIYLLPSLLLFTFIVFLPILYAIYYSQFNWMGGPNKTYIGFENFITLFQDVNFWNAFKNNIYLTVACIIGQLGIAFVLACLLSAKVLKLKGLHRTVSFFPYILSAVVVGFIWRMIYDYNYGLLNTFLNAVGLGEYARVWLSEPDGIMTVVSIPLIWQYIGMYLIILLAAMTSISPEVIEMAEIDGANGLQRALFITFPLIKQTFAICLMLCISGNMKAFDHIFAMTRGGPGYSSYVMAMSAYFTSFTEGKMGYGSAMSIMILVISLILVGGTRFLLNRVGSKEVE